MRGLAIAIAVVLAGAACGRLGGGPDERAFRQELPRSGPERYSAWFAAADGKVLYFGLSPFWTALAQRGDPRAELEQPGPHLIGRFDLAERRFLEPLVVRTPEQGARGSVWDVLAHSNGRIYYTTFFQEMGAVERDGTQVARFERLGAGLNELVEADGGQIVVTRYGVRDSAGKHRGGVAWVSPAGELLRETVLPEQDGVRTAPKSLAFDPASGEVWLNADRLGPGEQSGHEWLRLDPTGRVLERHTAPPELLFPAFDRAGRGWFAWDEQGRVVVRVREGDRDVARLELERRAPGDFAQDISFTRDGRALVSLWSGRVHVVELGPDRALRSRALAFQKPAECGSPGARALLYAAVAYRDRVYATLSCGATILSLPLAR